MSMLIPLAQQNAGGAGFAFTGALFIIFLIIAIATSIFWLWMLVDCLMSSKPAMEKLVWVVIIVFLHVIGALIYFIVGRSGRATMT